MSTNPAAAAVTAKGKTHCLRLFLYDIYSAFVIYFTETYFNNHVLYKMSMV